MLTAHWSACQPMLNLNTNFYKFTTKSINAMSQKSKISRARRDAKQEEEGKNVVKWIFISLIVLAVIYAVYISLI